MAARKGELRIRIVGDSRDVDKTLSKVQKKVGGFGSSLRSAGKKIAIFGGAVGGTMAFAAQQVLSFGGQLEQMDAKADTVFGGQIGKVRAWAKANARDMGLTSTELTGLAANFGDLLIPMKFTRKQAADMSKDVVGLAGALSEWSGGTRSATEVSQILAKAMLGERDSLKELGISITEADVQTRLLEKGQKDLTGTALQQAKAIATQELIFEKSTDAQAAYEAGTAKSIRTQARLSATFKEIRDTVIRAALPVVQKLASWLADTLPGAFAKAQQLAAEWGPKIGEVFGKVREVVGNVVKVIIGIFNTLKPALTGLAQFWKNVTQGIIDVVKLFVAIFKGDWSAAWKAVKGIFVNAWEAIRGLARYYINLVKTIILTVARVIRGVWDRIWDGLKAGFGAVWDGILAIASGALKALKSIINGMIAPINAVIRGLNIINPGPDVPSIPTFDTRSDAEKFNAEKRQHGGPVAAGRPYVVGERGPELFVPGRSGTIVPNGGGGDSHALAAVIARAVQAGMRGVTITLDGRVVAQAVDQRIGRTRFTEGRTGG